MSLRINRCVTRPLRPYRTPVKSAALRGAAVFAALSCMGCLRLGFEPQQQKDAGSPVRDAGVPDAGPAYAGGHGGSGGVGGTGGVAGGKAQAGESAQAGAAGGGGGAGRQGQAGAGAGGDDADAGGIPYDAGMSVPDAGAADSGMPVVYELCPEMPGMLFCSGFEEAGARWTSFKSTNGSTTPLTTLPRTDEYSLVTVTYGPAALSEARWTSEVLNKQKSGEAWMRFYNFIPSSVTVNEYFSVGFMSESAAPYDGFEFRVLPAGVDINAPGGAIAGIANVTFPRNAWVCVEMHVVIDDNAGFYEAYLNGTLAVKSGTRDTLPADGYTAAQIGIHYAGPNQNMVQVFVDDVVIARSRIGCN